MEDEKFRYILKIKRALQFCVLMFTAKIRYHLPPRGPLLGAGNVSGVLSIMW